MKTVVLQVDNPVSVLTQEMSKQFLQSKNEGDKYKVIKTTNVVSKIVFSVQKQQARPIWGMRC